MKKAASAILLAAALGLGGGGIAHAQGVDALSSTNGPAGGPFAGVVGSSSYSLEGVCGGGSLCALDRPTNPLSWAVGSILHLFGLADQPASPSSLS